MSALYSCLKGKNDTIMAAKSSEGTQTVENEETPGDCSGKKKSKFQAFKKLFVKKKRKESPAPSRDGNLKPSQSSSDVSVSGANESAFQPTHESVAKSGMGSKAVSHDSIFISEMESSTKEDTSQENIPGKVKALQLQLQQNIRIGSPPQGIVHKKLEDSGALSEDDGLPRSPPELTSLHEILALSSGKTPGIAQRRNSLSLGGTDSEDEQESREISSCPISPLNSGIPLSAISPGSRNLVDFSAPPSSVVCLDNSAAKHKIAVKPKKRKGPAMNINRIKDGTGITKDSLVKEMAKPENMVVCDHEVSIPHSAEQEASNEQDKIMEEMAQETEIDTTPSLIAQDDDDSSVNNTKTCEISFIGKQIVAPLTETSDSDVDFLASLNVEDQVNQNERGSKTERESNKISYGGQSAPIHEPNEITADMEPSACEDTAMETVHLEVSEDVECDIFEDHLKVQEETSVFEREDPIFNNQDQGYEEYAKVLPNLSELQNDLPEVTVGTSDTTVSTAPQKHILEIDLETSLIVVDEPVCHIASKCAVMCQSTDHKNDDKGVSTVEKLQEPIANTTNKQPRINDAPSTDKKLETFGLKRIESPMDLSIDDGGSNKCGTGSINSVSGANSSKDILCTKESSTEMSKTIKPTEVNVDSKLGTSNKPVRFTVAPAWQRSLSVGSGVKDAICSKNKVSSAMKSESFDESNHPVMDINQEDYRQSEKDNGMVKTNEDMCGAFGVRLRRTLSSRKYEEYPEVQSKLPLLPVETVSIVPTRNVQTSTKTPQPHLDFVKASKPSHTGEDKPQKKHKTEDLSSQENSEPAWITVAKLKQKGFQVHPLAKEHSASTESDKSEGSDESSQKKSAAASPQELGVNRMEPISTESQVVEENLPESGRSTQSATAQNPDEPPWFSLAKKKAKAWSKMPQIVQ